MLTMYIQFTGSKISSCTYQLQVNSKSKISQGEKISSELENCNYNNTNVWWIKLYRTWKFRNMKTYNIFSCHCIIETPHFCRIMQKAYTFIIPTCILRSLCRMLPDLVELVNNLSWKYLLQMERKGKQKAYFNSTDKGTWKLIFAA